MNILFVAVFSDTSTNNSQRDSLIKAGCEVFEYNYRVKVARFNNSVERDYDIVRACNRERPDLVLFSKCNGVRYEVIDECNKVSKTAFWFMDPAFNFKDEEKEKVKRCTHSFFALTEPYQAAKEQFPEHSIHFLHEGFDSTKNKPLDGIDYEWDVSFIGYLRGERSDYHEKYKFQQIGNAYGLDHSKAVCKSRINLNFTDGGTSDRSYKVLASRGFLLTQPWKDMEKDFTVNKDLVVFNNEKEYEEKVDYYLKHVKEREQIAENGYQTVQKFTRDEWAKQLLKYCK